MTHPKIPSNLSQVPEAFRGKIPIDEYWFSDGGASSLCCLKTHREMSIKVHLFYRTSSQKSIIQTPAGWLPMGSVVVDTAGNEMLG